VEVAGAFRGEIKRPERGLRRGCGEFLRAGKGVSVWKDCAERTSEKVIQLGGARDLHRGAIGNRTPNEYLAKDQKTLDRKAGKVA